MGTFRPAGGIGGQEMGSADGGDMRRVIDLTKELVAIESVTSNEIECARFIYDLLARQGYSVERQPVTDERCNVFARRGTPEIVLSTHIDTVPPYFPPSEDGEFIYGRGSCDAKGSLACQIAAAELLIAQGVGDFGLLFVVGEETGSDGARAANAAAKGSTTKYIVVGEPTENRLVVATKGTLALRLRARGRTAHSAYPERGESAIHRLLDALAALRAMPIPSDPELGATTMNIGLISGGRAANVVPDLAEADILFRTIDDGTELRRRIAAVLDGNCDYEFLRQTPTLRLERLDGFDTEVVAFTTDATHLGNWGCPLLLGPGSILQAHTANEHVRKADLARAVEQYQQIVLALKSRIAHERQAVEA
jgi:acetylornithine deacetylase